MLSFENNMQSFVYFVFFSWYSSLENTRWLQYLSALLRATYTIVDSINLKSQSVLVHCSDGWDRTTQIVSLSELLLDPYYRTIKVSVVSICLIISLFYQNYFKDIIVSVSISLKVLN